MIKSKNLHNEYKTKKTSYLFIIAIYLIPHSVNSVFATSYIASSYLGSTALSLFVAFGQKSATEYLIKKGANIEPKYGNNALSVAVENKQEEIVKYLIEKGANIEAKGDNGQTALMMAAYFGYKDILEILINKGANIEAKNDRGETSLIIAANCGKEETVKYLIEKGANIEAKDDDGQTALFCTKYLNVDRDGLKCLISRSSNIEYKKEKEWSLFENCFSRTTERVGFLFGITSSCEKQKID